MIKICDCRRSPRACQGLTRHARDMRTMSQRLPYVCRDCEQRVSSAAYRSSCPACGGTLRSSSVGG
ncbi:rubrerythrin-like domain-containing protein [Halobium palmae]|uniref:Rubrerythrin-like domain-containing protein n=1 Tax=Halobium palmae TaxID=1776492 RepID=A0ABD5S2L6_9EURY